MALQLSISVFPCDDAATARSALDPPRAVPLPRGLLEEAVGGPVEDAYVVNALDMPLFQFLSARRPQSSPLLELALIYPAFATQPVNDLAICIRWFAKEPKQLPQRRYHHLPLAVPADTPSSLTLKFQLIEDFASCVVAISWVCNFEVLSNQLEVDMKLVHAVMTASVKEFLSCEALAEIGHDETCSARGSLGLHQARVSDLAMCEKEGGELENRLGSTQHAHRLASMVPRVQKSWCLLTSCAC